MFTRSAIENNIALTTQPRRQRTAGDFLRAGLQAIGFLLLGAGLAVALVW